MPGHASSDPAETIIKVALIILFLLYAYFMIGGPTPCPTTLSTQSHIPSALPLEHCTACASHDKDNVSGPSWFSSDKNIFQLAPYLT